MFYFSWDCCWDLKQIHRVISVLGNFHGVCLTKGFSYVCGLTLADIIMNGLACCRVLL
jgi:hypothetical protein